MRQRTSIIWKPSKQEFALMVKNSCTMRELLSNFNLKNHGRNAHTIKQRISEDQLSIDHFALGGKALSKLPPKHKSELKDLLVDNCYSNRGAIKKRLIEQGILQEICSKCKMGNVWEGQKLVLVLDHINGKSTDYRIENLRLLCPNCNSQTPTFAGRNNKKREPNRCIDCLTKICPKSKRCMSCNGKFSVKYKLKTKCPGRYPDPKILKEEVDSSSFVAVGKKYKVSDNAIRKFLIRRGYKF